MRAAFIIVIIVYIFFKTSMSTPEILGKAGHSNDLWSRRMSSGPGVLLHAGRVAHFLRYSIHMKILLKFSRGIRSMHFFFFFFFFLQYSSIYRVNTPEVPKCLGRTLQAGWTFLCLPLVWSESRPGVKRIGVSLWRWNQSELKRVITPSFNQRLQRWCFF